jgi:hypothetical protein
MKFRFVGFCVAASSLLLPASVSADRSNRFPTLAVISRGLIALATLFLMAMAARADALYCYTGNDFEYVNPPFTTSDSFSGCVTLTVALPTDTTPLTDYTSDMISYQFTDGVDPYFSSTNPNIISGGVEFATTFGSGITRWVFYSGGDAGLMQILNEFDDVYDYVNYGGGGIGVGINVEEPGEWAQATVPEPSSVILLMTAIAFAGLLLGKKLRPRSSPTIE